MVSTVKARSALGICRDNSPLSHQLSMPPALGRRRVGFTGLKSFKFLPLHVAFNSQMTPQGIFPTSGHAKANSTAPSNPASGWGRLSQTDFLKNRFGYKILTVETALWCNEVLNIHSAPPKGQRTECPGGRHLCLERPTDNIVIFDSSWVSCCCSSCPSRYTHFPWRQPHPLVCFTQCPLAEPVLSSSMPVSQGRVSMQQGDKQAIVFCYWTRYQHDFDIWGELSFSYIPVVPFLIKNLSNRSARVRMTRKSYFSHKFDCIPTFTVPQQLGGCSWSALELEGPGSASQFLNQVSLKDFTEASAIMFSF